MTTERVLLALDPETDEWTHRLFQSAIDVAEPAGATVYVLNVFSETDYDELREEMDVASGFGTPSPDDFAGRLEGIQAPVERLTERGVDWEVRGISGGDPADQISRTAGELDADIVVVGGERASPTGKAVFGDLAQKVLLGAPCPVLYVRADL